MAILELTEKEIKVKEAPKKKDKHDHKHSTPPAKGGSASGGKAETQKTAGKAETESHPKHGGAEPKKEKPKPGFFKNLGKFFRNKGGG